MAISSTEKDFWDALRENEPDVLQATLWCRLIPHLHEEYPCTNTTTTQHPKKHYQQWILKYQDLFNGVSDAHYIEKHLYYKDATLRGIQECYARVINQVRRLDEEFDYSKFLGWITLLNIPANKVWDLEDLDRALRVKLELHSGNEEKCKNLREAHNCLSKYVEYNIDFMDEYMKKMDKDTASQAWLEAYAEAKTRETESDENVPNLDNGDKVGNGVAKKNVGDANVTDKEESSEGKEQDGNADHKKNEEKGNQEESGDNDTNDGNDSEEEGNNNNGNEEDKDRNDENKKETGNNKEDKDKKEEKNDDKEEKKGKNEEEKDKSKEEMGETERQAKRKFDIGAIELPYTFPVKITPTSSYFSPGKLLQYDEEKWTGLIEWDSTKETQEVSLDLIDLPSNIGSIRDPIDLLHDNGTPTKLRPSRECQLKRVGSRTSDVTVPITAHGKAAMPGVSSSSSSSRKVPMTAHGKEQMRVRKRKATEKTEKKAATVQKQKKMKKKVVCSSTTSSPSLFDDCKKLAKEFNKKKNYDFRELFALPKNGNFSQHQLNVGYVNALLRHVKTHEDANEAIR